VRATAPFHGLATRLGAGAAARKYYHEPIGQFRQMVREGGPLEQRRTEQGRLEMVRAASDLPPLQSPVSETEYRVSFLSGDRFWYQTLFCIYSLQIHSPVRIAPTIYDDGSFSDGKMAAISRVAPWTRFVARSEIDDRLDQQLPVARFPTLRARRIDYVHLRKLTDVHLGRRGWTTVLDSDMLFFRRPTALLNWFAAPDRPCHLIDCEPSYGYSPELLEELAGQPIPELVNVGVCSLRSETIDWDRLEYWCRATLEREGPAYVQEQALTALLLAGQDSLRLPSEDYQVRPRVAEGRAPTAALHHYVAQSKRSYFQDGWRRVLESARRGVEGSP
jgi:hypothetical protein